MPFKIIDLTRPIIAEIIKKSIRIRRINYLFKKIRNRTLYNLFGGHSGIYKLITKKIFMIRISWGCISNCAYCGIKNAVGPLRSKPIEQCVREFQKGLDQGYKDFILCADNMGPYGIDIGSSFPELLDKLTNIPGEYDILIRYLDPRWAIKYVDKLEEILKRNKITSIDIPIQSGSSRILKLMNRYNDVETMKDTILRLKKTIPNLEIITHIIVGFPGETEEDFKQTLDFIEETNLDFGFILPFSLKTGSKAEKIEPKVPQKEIWRRIKYIKRFLRSMGYNVVYIPTCKFMLFGKIRKTRHFE
jgi:MiaB/RimO family radical SAM methylthiotransferase